MFLQRRGADCYVGGNPIPGHGNMGEKEEEGGGKEEGWKMKGQDGQGQVYLFDHWK